MNNDINDYRKELNNKYMKSMYAKIRKLYLYRFLLIIPFIIALSYWWMPGMRVLAGNLEYLKDTLPSFTIMVLCLIGRKYFSYKLSTRWVNVGGHIMFNMDMPMYLHNIQNKLIPKLMEKGIILNNRYSHISPGEVIFETKNTEPRLRFRFYNARIEIINEKNYSYPMFTCVSTATHADKFIDKDTLGVIGEIDLMTEEHVDEAIRLIINKINELYEKGYINKIITDEEN